MKCGENVHSICSTASDVLKRVFYMQSMQIIKQLDLRLL